MKIIIKVYHVCDLFLKQAIYYSVGSALALTVWNLISPWQLVYSCFFCFFLNISQGNITNIHVNKKEYGDILGGLWK